MRNTRRERFYAAGWVMSCLVAVAAAVQWNGRIREAEQRTAEMERTQEAAARSRAAEERLRIARELHDSLTHNISVITVQAGVAAHLARKRGEEVPDALAAITEAATEASRELRQTLQVLRREELPAGAGLADLPALIARTASIGLPVTVHRTGPQRDLPAAVDTAAYRIVQESLTNTSRHSAGGSAVVTITYEPRCVQVLVEDDGSGRASEAHRPGLGLIGMRERAAALGGSLVAYTRPDDGGFTVQAILPLEQP